MNITTDTLRYYDDIGLLKPCHIEQDSRYRYYSEDQVNQMLQIMDWKLYGFNLEEIKELMKYTDSSQLLSSFQAQLSKLKHEMALLEQSILSLQRRISEIERKNENGSTQPTVLLVDDSDFMRTILKDLFDKHNYVIAGEAASGQEGVEKCISLKPQLVIMDIRMAEEEDGIMALQQIKARNINTKIIMLSALSSLPVVMKSLQAGANCFIAKPFQADTLFDAVEAVMGNPICYPADSISALITGSDLQSSAFNEPLSQALIFELQELCSAAYPADDNRITGFINNLIS